MTRSQWGALPPKATTKLPLLAIRFLVVHYSAMNADERPDHAECAGRVRGIQRYHMTSDQLTPGGASDIAYNWLVCRHGFIFRGRGLTVRSAATGPANGYSVAVCFLGNDDVGKRDATPEARDAIRNLRDFIRYYAENYVGVRGHRDFMQTSCPGDELHAFARALN